MIPITPARRTTAATATAVVLATAAGLLTAAAAPATAAVTCTSPVYKQQFFANTSFSGTPTKTVCDSAIDQDWGTGAPASGLPSNNFGVRWSVTRDFGSGGPFTFTASGLDGIRVYLDGTRKIDLWKNLSTTVSKTVNLTIPSGKHTLRVDYVNWTGSAKVKFTYTPRTSATVDTVKPLAPTGLAATYTTATQQTKLTWSKNKEMDLAGYRVHRQVAGSGSWKLLTTTTGTSYTDTPPANGATYEYLVVAMDKAGNLSPETARTTVTSTALGTPTGFTATGTDTGVALSWNAVPGASRYRVIRTGANVPSVSWQPTGTSMTDTSVARSVDFTYKVAAVDASGGAVTYTAATTARRLVAAPTELKAFPQWSSITLTWRMDEDEDTGGDYRGFHVYRYREATGSWIRLQYCDPYRRTLADGSVQHLCTDSSLEPGDTHRYAIAAYDKYETDSDRTAEVVAKASTDGTGPSAPVATATPSDWGTTVTWEPVTDADLDRYSVRRGTTVVEGGSTVCSAPEHIGYAEVDETSYRDANPADGEKLCYVVRPVDFAGNAGTGTTLHITEPDLRPTVQTPSGATHTAWASVTSFGTDVALTLTSPAGTEDYYGTRVSRWNPQTGTFDPLPESDYSPLYDRGVPTGTTLWYQVSGVREDGSSSLPVLVSVAVPPLS
ncbi:PA14 domain-containing protein [Streptomyces sp. DSM 40750]|nr:PA14 domain-containing protein [Streptomyces sp. DSM 40750]UUU23816.1 PA14 domain-containing protein [Streptomyces sp. DSM 40750]